MSGLPNGMDGRGMHKMLGLLEKACMRGATASEVEGAVSRLIHESWERGWMPVFDWPDWAHSEGKALMENQDRLERADLETVRKLLTAYIRQDRFIEGLLEGGVRDGSLVPVMRRLVECWREADPVGAWLDEHDCFVPAQTGWEEIQGTVGLSAVAWDRLKQHGFIGDMDCKWVIARVFRMYGMWRMSSPGAPLLVLSREGAQGVRGWLNPRQDEVDGPFLLAAFESAATYRPQRG